MCVRGSSGWQAGLDYQQDSGLKQLGFGPLHGLWGKKAYVPMVSCPTGTESPSGEEQSKQLGLS